MTMLKEHLKKKLVDKATREQEDYIEQLKKLPPEKILEKEIVKGEKYLCLMEEEKLIIQNKQYCKKTSHASAWLVL